MWLLQGNSGQRYYLPVGKKISIGRRGTDIIVAGDQSISRAHAVVEVGSEAGGLTITDQNSKYGSRVNQTKLSGGAPVPLQHGSIFTLGQGNSKFRVAQEKLVFCCSNMEPGVKQEVKQLAEALGGTLVNSWSSHSTHLVMSSVTVTVKVVCALASARPIVSLAWLREAITCFKAKKLLPLSESFMPELTDSNLQETSNLSIAPKLARRGVFKNTTVYFLVKKQFSRLQYCISAGGGTAMLLHSAQQQPQEDLGSPNVMVISPDQKEPWMDKITSQLSSKNLRLIPESEIGYAILYCSKERFCNPAATIEYSQMPPQLAAPTLSQNVMSQAHSTFQGTIPYTQEATQTQSNVSILAYNSESSVVKRRSTSGGGEEKVVDETILKTTQSTELDDLFSMESQKPSLSVKHPLTTDNEQGQGPAHKKPRISGLALAHKVTKDTVMEDSNQETGTHTTIPPQFKSPPGTPHDRSMDANSTLLAANSMSTSSQQASSIPSSGVIASAFKNKRNRVDSDQSDTIPQPQLKKLKLSQKIQSHTQSQFQSSQQATPSKFLSARRRQATPPGSPQGKINSPCKHSPTPAAPNGVSQASALDTENPIPTINHATTTSASSSTSSSSSTTASKCLSIFSNVRSKRLTVKSQKSPQTQTSLFSTQKAHDPNGGVVKKGQGSRVTDFEFDDEPQEVKEEEVWTSSQLEERLKPKYEAVLTSDGFICARKKPRKKAPSTQLTRFQQLQARLQLQEEEDEECHQQKTQRRAPPPPACPVEWTTSMFRRVKQEKSVDDHTTTNGTKNFKKFRKVQNIGSGQAHSRLIGGSSLTVYTGRKLFHDSMISQRHKKPHPPQSQDSLFY